MKKLIFILFFLFLMGSCDTKGPGGGTITDDKGKLGQPCKDDGTCIGTLICSKENVCEQTTQVDCTPNITEPCYTGSGITLGKGPCKAGERTCSAEGIWGACIGEVTPSNEMCGDNIDNNCNGEKDENCDCETVGETRSCYTGPQNTANIGICVTGFVTCQENHTWSSDCIGEVKPITEICSDNLDNDCNGSVNDNCGSCVPGDQRECYSGNANTKGIGICKAGKEICTPEFAWSGSCVGEVLPQNSEACGDGLDNNCNSQIDEACPCNPGEQRSCYTGNESERGKGICRNGVQVCNHSGQWEQNCVGQQLPQNESCDNLDNDCDGLIDDGVSNSCGQCGAEPQETCDGMDNNCNGLIDEGVKNACGTCGTIPSEICNDGIDNNCDGEIDENCYVNCNGDPNCNTSWECKPFNDDGEPTTRHCYSGPPQTKGVGMCHDGTQICLNGFWSGCQYEALPNVEVCDNKDNDCDGTVDDSCGFDNCTGFEVCGDNIDNDCDNSIDEDCSSVPVCIPTGAENCSDNLDNDCNGYVNDGCTCTSGATEQCFTGPQDAINVGECKGGSQSCIGGEAWGACTGQILPKQETCNSKDDDCDGIVDNGYFTGMPCVVGNGACQRSGVYQCNAQGTASCVDTNGVAVVAGQPGEELCDGIDNNCNGDVDEGYILNQPCHSGYGICRTNGRTICSADKTTVSCNAQAGVAQTEVCGDNLDNDCNGQIDDVIGIGAVCTAGEGACSDTGEYECVSGQILCNANPVTPLDYEACGDNVDNNCNGSTDEGFEALGTTCESGVGACKRNGSYICSTNLRSLDCNAVPGQGSAEICGDSTDNDCDGLTDNDPELNLGFACNSGQGICQRSGQFVCTNRAVTCSATAGNPDSRGEICANGLDDNCNGSIDEQPCLSLNRGPVVTCPTPPLERNATIDQWGGRAFTLKNYTLTASASDPNNDAMTYKWEVISAPNGNDQDPTPANALATVFNPYLISARQTGDPQPYILRFTATETNTAEHLSAACEVKFLAISEDYIHVELIWTNTVDMDLHMVVPVGTDASFSRSAGAGYDCNYSNCKSGMSWSGAANSSQYPYLDIDNIAGFGCATGNDCNKPENINIPTPRLNSGDVYRVGVHAYSGTGANLRIKVNCLGQNNIDVIKEYFYSSLGNQGWWMPSNITWNGSYCTVQDR